MVAVVLVTGASGLLGPYLVEAAAVLGHVVATGRGGGDRPCDLTDREAVSAMLADVRPDLVIHAAGMTDVDSCEADEEAANRVNRDGTTHLADFLPAKAKVVYVSTDQVYPDTPGPHAEGEEAPVNVYGRSKLAGEKAVLSRSESLVLRTNLFGPSRMPGRASLSDFVATKLAAHEPVTLFRDVLFSPLHMATLASLLVDCVKEGLRGVYNLGSRGGMSKLEFGLAVARRLGLSTASVTPGDAVHVPGRAPRPADLRLVVERIEGALGRVMPTLNQEISKLGEQRP